MSHTADTGRSATSRSAHPQSRAAGGEARESNTVFLLVVVPQVPEREFVWLHLRPPDSSTLVVGH